MKNYWSNTKLADVLRGTPKPNSASFEEWDAWAIKAKISHPFRYWLSEELLDEIQKILYFPQTVWRALHCYILNRWITQTHSLQSNLVKGKYYDLDDRILNCLFDELVNFVEIEKAYHSITYEPQISSDSLRQKLIRKIAFKQYRSAAVGIKSLEDESKLTYDDDEVAQDASKQGKVTPQARAAREILEIYRWWTIDRPSREERELATNASEPPDCGEEDTEMLIRLIKIRGALWT